MVATQVLPGERLALPSNPQPKSVSGHRYAIERSLDSARWRAVQTRDPAADGTFVYAVRTTKIYCRPVCKARLANRANVSFFLQPKDAEGAGFRACKRCRPELTGPMLEDAAVRRVRSLVERELLNPTGPAHDRDGQADAAHSTGSLARKAKVSKWHFHRIFKEVTGMTPAEFAQQRRRDDASESATPPSMDGDAAFGPNFVAPSHLTASDFDWLDTFDWDQYLKSLEVTPDLDGSGA